MPNKYKFWNFVNVDAESTDLLIYDTIANQKSVDWWTGEKNNEATPTEFKEELKGVTTNHICVRINSGGGDVFAAVAIATAIKEERNNGKKVTCKIDGICASAAVQIAMACESIAIPTSAYIMIHNPLTLLIGYYQTQDLEKTITTLNTIKDGIINAYVEKTGIDKKEIDKLMTDETWFTGDEAVEKGFADEILEVDTEETIENNINNLYQNEYQMQFAAFTKVPEIIKNSAFNVKTLKNNQIKEQKGAKTDMEIKNVAEMQKAFPEFCSEIMENAKNEAVKEERARMQAIDELADKVDAELVNKAKYETFENAEKLAFTAMKEGKFVNTSVIDNIAEDAQGANAVNGNVTNNNSVDEKAEAKTAIDNIAKKLFK